MEQPSLKTRAWRNGANADTLLLTEVYCISWHCIALQHIDAIVTNKDEIKGVTDGQRYGCTDLAPVNLQKLCFT